VERWEGDLWAGKAKGSDASWQVRSWQTSMNHNTTPTVQGHATAQLQLSNQSPVMSAGSRRGASADHVRDRARPLRVGNRDRRQSEGLGQGSDRPDKFAGKISAADEPAWLRDRAWTARDLGQVNDLFSRRVRLQVSVDDELPKSLPQKRLQKSLPQARAGVTRARCTVGAALTSNGRALTRNKAER
jgi:hypothetical protein